MVRIGVVGLGGMVGFNNRFSPSTALFKTCHEAGRFGDITQVEANLVRRRKVPGSWFTDPELSGGGVLIDNGVHLIDLVLYVLDFPSVVEVSGTTYREPHRGESAAPDVELSASAFLRLETGTEVSLELAWAANRPPDREITLRGTDGGARFAFSDDALELCETEVDGGEHHADGHLSAPGGTDNSLQQDALFLESIADGTHPGTNTFEEALLTQRVVDAVYRSAEAGHAIRLD